MSPDGIVLNADSSEAGTSSSIKSKSSRKRRNKYVPKNPLKKKSHVGEFLGALAIYAICVSLPTICYIIKSWYETHMSHPNTEQDYTNSADGTPIPLVVEKEESITNLARKANDDLWSPYSNTYDRDENLPELPAFVILFIRQIKPFIKRDALSDVQVVIAISLLLSLIRVVIVQMLVPRYLAPRRLAAMVQTKSSNLLSSAEYQFQQNESIHDGESDFHSFSGDKEKETNRSRKSSVKKYVYKFLVHALNSVRRSLGHETQTQYNDMDAIEAVHLFTAPRYATAIFRLLFCLVSCFWALSKFSSANFWPVWVGGQRTASTKNCWDLSGSVALQGASLDSDFDHQNSALRYFFLGQASYQIHSICFHILTMMLLVIYGGKDGYLSARQSLTSYSRPMLEHLVYFVLTVAVYTFSSLRRLGAITIFALELSSMMLQFLQICINAPKTSPIRNDRLIKFVHHFLAVPVFIYCRFFIMPFIVQHSAAFESAMWLQQIERLFNLV